MAAEQLNHPIDKTMSICKVEERLNITYTDREQFQGVLYPKLRELCKDFKPRPAPPVVVSATSQPVLVPEIISPGTPLLNNPPRPDSEPPPQNVDPQTIVAEEPARNMSECQLEGTGLHIEAEVPSPVVLSSGSIFFLPS